MEGPELPFPLPVWFLVLPGFPFRVPLRIPGSGFCIRVACPAGSVSRSRVGFETRACPTKGERACWGRTGGGGCKAWVCLQTTKCTAASARLPTCKEVEDTTKENGKLNGSDIDTGTPNGSTNRTEPKKQVENEMEATTEDPGEAEDRTETTQKQKRKIKHTRAPQASGDYKPNCMESCENHTTSREPSNVRLTWAPPVTSRTCASMRKLPIEQRRPETLRRW